MGDSEYYSHLYEIAKFINKEYSLHAALRKALEKTVELLHLETGWIWLLEENSKNVYLAASYNLPPALSKHPERLSGNCYCISKYLADGITTALNINEITCTRLKDITAGTRGLKFHATVPITIEGQKIGLINIVSKETQELDDKQLCVLNTIGELVSFAIQRTRIAGAIHNGSADQENALSEVLKRVISPSIDELAIDLLNAKTLIDEKKYDQLSNHLNSSLLQVEELKHQLSHITEGQKQSTASEGIQIRYVNSLLTKRELETLTLVKKGFTNNQIAEQLYISERTVKFHVSSILSKLMANTRTEAVETALQQGLL